MNNTRTITIQIEERLTPNKNSWSLTKVKPQAEIPVASGTLKPRKPRQ